MTTEPTRLLSAQLAQLMSDLADLIARIRPDRAGLPTPCPDFDVQGLRSHVLGWLPMFAAALSDPDAEAPRPDPQAHTAPSDPAAAAAEVSDCAKQVGAALDAGVANRPVHFMGDDPAPGSMIVSMLAAEVILHGWDLARAAGLPWDPSSAACESALAALRGMLTPEFRGPGQGFDAEVPVDEGATALDRLVGFSGRDPAWTPAPPSP